MAESGKTRASRLAILEATVQNSYQFISLSVITNMDHTQADAESILGFKRDYWQVENVLHYCKDFVFGEDRCTIRRGNGPYNMATLRNFAIGLLKSNGITNIKRCVENLRYSSASEWHHALFGFQQPLLC